MNVLKVFSYVCGIAGLLACSTSLISLFQEWKGFENEMLYSLLLFIPPITQLIYTKRCADAFQYPVFKATESLDDFAMNEMEIGDIVITNNVWFKGFITINTAMLCFIFYFSFVGMRNLISAISELNESPVDSITVLLIFIIGLTAVPTIIFNLRTYNLSRIKSVSHEII